MNNCNSLYPNKYSPERCAVMYVCSTYLSKYNSSLYIRAKPGHRPYIQRPVPVPSRVNWATRYIPHVLVCFLPVHPRQTAAGVRLTGLDPVTRPPQLSLLSGRGGAADRTPFRLFRRDVAGDSDSSCSTAGARIRPRRSSFRQFIRLDRHHGRPGVSGLSPPPSPAAQIEWDKGERN